MDGAFDPKDPVEVDVFAFDFTARLDDSETVDSVVAVDVVVVDGTDASPNAMKSGAAAIDGAGKVVRQKLQGGVDGVTYELRVTVTTSQSKTLKGCGTVIVAAC